MKQPSIGQPTPLIKVAKETIMAQRGLLLCVRRTAWWLFEHELTRTDPETGELYAPYQALDHVLKWMAEQAEVLEKVKQEPTQMQRRLLQMLVDGKSGKQIALEMSIHEKTLRTHFARMRSRIGVETLFQVVALSVKKGWITVRRPEGSQQRYANARKSK